MEAKSLGLFLLSMSLFPLRTEPSQGSEHDSFLPVLRGHPRLVGSLHFVKGKTGQKGRHLEKARLFLAHSSSSSPKHHRSPQRQEKGEKAPAALSAPTSRFLSFGKRTGNTRRHGRARKWLEVAGVALSRVQWSGSSFRQHLLTAVCPSPPDK